VRQYLHPLLHQERPGHVRFGGARMAFLDMDGGLWALRRHLEALVGSRLAALVLQQAGAAGGASFASSLAGSLSGLAGPAPMDRAAALSDCVAAYEAAGYGHWEIEQLQWPVGVMRVRVTGSPEAGMFLHHGRLADAPVCDYAAGILVGFVNVLSDRRDVVCIERSCAAAGGDACIFELLPAREAEAPAVGFDPDPFLSRQVSLMDLLFDRMPMGIAVFDANMTLRRFNPTWADSVARYTRTPLERVVPGARLDDLVPGVTTRYAERFSRIMSGEVLELQENRVLTDDGMCSYWDMTLTPLLDHGRVSGFVLVMADATERVLAYQELERRVEERTREIERRRAVAEALREILAVLNSDRPLLEILNRIVAQTGRLMGTDTAAIYRLRENALTVRASCGLPADFVANISVPVGYGAVGRAVETRQAVSWDPAEITGREAFGPTDVERSRLQAELSQEYRSILSVPLIIKEEVYGGISLYYREARTFSAEDVAIAVAFADQAALAIENARLRERSERAAVAAERSRLARELHDAVTQTLFSASLIAEVMPKLWERDREEARRRLAELRQLTRGALAEMRTLLMELRPSAMVEADLKDLLVQLGEAMNGRTRIPVTVAAQGRYPLPPEVQVALYRVAQEALGNVAKHAAAQHVHVELLCGDRGVELTIADDGVGFDPAGAGPDQAGLGIMRERADSVGARVWLESRPGSGTTVFVRWTPNQEVQGQ
jgi:signal transduction histidine kinase/predicted hydrocarbon binding protein